MFKNYLKLALRNIARKKLYTAINLAGLGVASAFGILVYWFIQHEQSFDRFHIHEKQLYRFEIGNTVGDTRKEEKERSFFSFLMKEADQKNIIATPLILAIDLQNTFPEIEHAVRLQIAYEPIVRVNNQGFKEKENVAYADSDFFQVFSFPLKAGNPATVLSARNSIVISEKAALKYFGHTDPIGKTILLTSEGNTMYTVSGVAKNFPDNSSFQFDLIMPRTSRSDYEENLSNGLNTFSDKLILQLKKGTNMNVFRQKLDAFGKQYFKAVFKEWATPENEVKPEDFHLFLRPFAEAHFNASPGWPHYTDLQNVYQLVCLAVVILLIACLNYILLTLTSTVSRSQEVGIRKTVGASRKEVVWQFYTETQTLSFFAVAIGFFLAVVCLPLFSSLTGSELRLSFFSVTSITGLLLSLAIVLGLLPGIYPALVMSRLKPLNMMRNFSAYRLNPFLSRILVVTQFSVCIILIVSSLVIRQQMRYINETKLGFDKDQVIAIQNPSDDPTSAAQLKERLYHFAATETAIQDVTGTFAPFGRYNYNMHNINGRKIPIEVLNVDYDYFSFFKIPLVEGRSFSRNIASDSVQAAYTDEQLREGVSKARQAVVVNETLYNLLGHPPLNEYNRDLGGSIIGVCKDYHIDDLTKKIEPAYHRIEKGNFSVFWLRIKSRQNIPQVMSKIKKTWDKLTANQPFSYTFLDEELAKSYDAYLRWMQTVTASSILAILIACMGLFGLSGLTTVNRTKEIGIRKVLGASVSNLFLLLNRGTFLLSLISCAVAIPIAVYLTNTWLQNFAYRVYPGWMLFIVSGIVSMLAAFAAVSYHTVKTARANPVKSLRTE